MFKKSNRDRIAHVHEDRVDALGHLEGLIYGVIHQLLTLHADDAVILALLQQAHGMVAHCRSVHTVTQSGRTTALDMAQNGGAGVDAGVECALLTRIVPDLDAVSFGPDALDIHSEHERISLETIDRFWLTLKDVLETFAKARK